MIANEKGNVHANAWSGKKKTNRDKIDWFSSQQARKGRGIMTNKTRSEPSGVVDMELHCVACGARLYVAVPQAGAVIASLKRTGAAILVCMCGQAQLIRWKRQKRND